MFMNGNWLRIFSMQNITAEAVSSAGYIGKIFVHIIYRAIYLGLRWFILFCFAWQNAIRYVRWIKETVYQYFIGYRLPLSNQCQCQFFRRKLICFFAIIRWTAIFEDVKKDQFWTHYDEVFYGSIYFYDFQSTFYCDGENISFQLQPGIWELKH